MNFIRTIIGLPLVIILVVFAVMNSENIKLSLWPLGINVELSMGLAIVFFVVLGYILGRVDAWLVNSPLRKQLREQKRQNKKLSVEQVKLSGKVETLKGDLETAKKETIKSKSDDAYPPMPVENLKASQPKAKNKTGFKDKFKNLFKSKPQEDDFWCL